MLTVLVAYAFAGLLWILFRTLRIKIVTGTPETSPFNRDSHERYLYCVWHDSIVLPVFGGRHWCTTALTSSHRDGSFVASILGLRNIQTVRGSTNRIRTTALRQLLQTVQSRHLVITPDGPRGPNRTMSSGIVYLASRTGRGIVPTAFACSNCWRWQGTWSELIIPKPFSTIVMLAGQPIFVPADATRDDLHAYVEEVQTVMNQMDLDSQALANGQTADSHQEVASLESNVAKERIR
ncbi:lysophospholipid acyltransferase family protein [Bremerella cremea]|uniref:lysophospholipid acyltransferase family protein n=1 Tax=Bremerella cremea TaxID=1031537 RepID=UPI00131417FA|nr:lysophospholipid acyltransferase family protein [Bremerella cremea]